MTIPYYLEIMGVQTLAHMDSDLHFWNLGFALSHVGFACSQATAR